MAYNRNIPAATDLISNSQSQIQGNFQALDSGTTGTGVGFSRNHVTITDATNGGLHNRIDFYQNLTDPTISAFVSSLYPKTVSAATELMYSNSTGVTTQITSGALPIWKGGSTASGVVTATVSQNGQLNLPNGLQFRWGRETAVTDGQTINFTPAFTNACFSIQITGQRSNSDVRSLWVSAVPSASSFVVQTSAASIDIWFFAVGN